MSTVLETSEKGFQGAVIDLAKRTGWRVAHFHDSRRQIRPGVFVGDTSSKGFPDLVLVRHYSLIFAELKAEKGRVKAEQREWLDTLSHMAAGDTTYPACPSDGPYVEVHVWRPRDWEQIESVLR